VDTLQANHPQSGPTGEGGADVGLQGSRGADVQAFQAFYQENLGVIFRFVLSKVGNREEAEDITSQIFIKAVRGVETERSRLSMQKWLFQVARTTISDYWRARHRQASLSLDELMEAGWESPVKEERRSMSSPSPERVQRILQALPEHFRDVLTCRFLLNLSIKETAAQMGLSETNVKVLQFRALKRAAAFENVGT
jgi:RNA polymerase sigma-70 factor (ECF subfamily)